MSLKMASVAIGVAAVFCFQTPAFSDQIRLDNGDQLTGEVTAVTDEKVTIRTAAAGEVTVDRKHIRRIDPAQCVEKKKVLPPPPKYWSGKAGLGYGKSSGNTKTEELNGRFAANRKQDNREVNLKADAAYASRDKRMNTQKWYVMGQYAHNFGAMDRWNAFTKLEVDHDRFADIDARLIPLVGLGYGWRKEEAWTLMVDIGVGAEGTRYRSSRESTIQAVVAPHLLAERLFFGKLKLSEDATLYPALKDTGEFRLRSETAVEYPFSEVLAGRLSFIDEYNSNPASGTKKSDVRVVSSLVWKF
jgi:putative salt-induced outer membrane protein